MSSKSYRYVVYLEDDDADVKKIKKAFTRIRRSFAEYLQSQFGWTCGLELVTARNFEELKAILFDDQGRATEVAEKCVLFLLDYYLESPMHSTVSGRQMPFHIDMLMELQPGHTTSISSWLNSCLPAIPKVIFTSKAPEDIARQDIRELSKDILNNPDSIKRQLNHCFKQWWELKFWNELKAYGADTGDDSWHTPGHNRGSAFLRSKVLRGLYTFYEKGTFATDLSVSVETLGDLSEPRLPNGESHALDEARWRTAEIFGAEETFYITNGTSTSNKAMLMTLLHPGDVVLLDRNCHKSVHQAVVMSGALPLYLAPRFNKRLGIWAPLSLDVIWKALTADFPAGAKPRMLVLTTCTYDGMLYPIQEIARRCEEHGIILYADEAWAPHLRFHPYYACPSGTSVKPRDAMGAGADFAVQSTHKALAAFSQASMIHVSSGFRRKLEQPTEGFNWLHTRFGNYWHFRHQLLETLRYWHSTSPHYPMMATLDCAGVHMRLEGAERIGELLKWITKAGEDFDNEQGCVIRRREIVGDSRDYELFMHDPLKLILGFRGNSEREQKLNGKRFKNALKEANIQYEKSTIGCIEFLATVGTYINDLNNLKQVVRKNIHCLGRVTPTDSDFDTSLVSGQVEVTPRKAALSVGELVPLAESTNRIYAQMVVPYPPGIPVFLPGLRIGEAIVKLVTSVAESAPDSVHGLFSDNEQLYVKVMQPREEKSAIDSDATLTSEISKIVMGFQA